MQKERKTIKVRQNNNTLAIKQSQRPFLALPQGLWIVS